MDDFEELMLPSHTNGITPQLWFVEAMQIDKYLINEEPTYLEELGNFPDPRFYFASEAAAHSAAADYYMDNGKPYPYIKEFEESCKDLEEAYLNKLANEDNTGDVQSQEMIF
jgi:hypothetical protein